MHQPMDKKYRELDDYIQCFKLAFPRQLHLAAEALKQFIVLGVNISELLPGYVQMYNDQLAYIFYTLPQLSLNLRSIRSILVS